MTSCSPITSKAGKSWHYREIWGCNHATSLLSMCVCSYVCTLVWGGVHVLTIYVWRSEDKFTRPYSGYIPTAVWESSSHWPATLPSAHLRLTGLHLSLPPILPWLESQGCHTLPAFTRDLGIWTQVLRLGKQAVYGQSHLSSPQTQKLLNLGTVMNLSSIYQMRWPHHTCHRNRADDFGNRNWHGTRTCSVRKQKQRGGTRLT